MPEKRTNARHRVLKAATIEFGGGAIDCMVRNMSGRRGGAGRQQPDWHPRTFHAGARRRRTPQALSCRLAQGKADRRGIRLAASSCQSVSGSESTTNWKNH